MEDKISRKLKKIFILILGFLLLILCYSLVEPYLVKTKEISYESSDIPQEFDQFKIVFLTDLHVGKAFSPKRVGKIVKRVNKLEPDLILLGGDYIDHDIEYVEPCFEELSDLDSQYGVYGVMGNHDYAANYDFMTQVMKESGIILLDNKSEWINIGEGSIKIGGVEDFWNGDQILEATISDTEKDDFVLLVSHNPDYAEEIESDKVDLMLAGHTHGGQITLFGLYAPLLPSKYGQKYKSGMVYLDNFDVYVSNGVGLNLLPMRLGARPEITVVVLEASE